MMKSTEALVHNEDEEGNIRACSRLSLVGIVYLDSTSLTLKAAIPRLFMNLPHAAYRLANFLISLLRLLHRRRPITTT